MLYRGLGRIDATFGAASWREGLEWLAYHEPDRPIGEVQYWGHGRWGRIFVADDVLDAAALAPGHALHPALAAVKARLLPEGRSLVWLRTCEAFGADAGKDFAVRLADALGARVAGHTFIIGAVQSGLRALRPGARPTWSGTEGLKKGSAAKPEEASGSSLLAPRTITCLEGRFPTAWFDEDGG